MKRVERISKHVAAPCRHPSGAPVPRGASSNAAPAPPPDGQKVITLIGAGNSGHVCAALIEENTKGRYAVQLLTSNPGIWKTMTPRVSFPDGSVQVGKLLAVSDDPGKLLPQSDIILWTGPVTQTKAIFEQIKPFMDVRRQAIGTIFAQGLVHLLAQRVFGADVHFFALRNIPWLCRCTTKGEESVVVGAKSSIDVMTMNLDKEWVKRELEPLFVVQKTGKWEPVIEVLPDFCPVVFNPANQIIHPARYWSMFRGWRGRPLAGKDEPSEWLYKGMDEVAGETLQVLDEELQMLKDAYYEATGAEGCRHVRTLRERLLDQYGDQIEDTSTMAKMVGTNKAYSMARTPVIRTRLGVMPDPNHRVLTDDIGWGLCVMVSIAERLESAGIHTPTTVMRMLIDWHQKVMGKEFLVNGRLCGKDCAELVLLRPGDSLELVAKPPPGGSSRISRAEQTADEDRIGNP